MGVRIGRGVRVRVRVRGNSRGLVGRAKGIRG
jgi:hypothetical protein